MPHNDRKNINPRRSIPNDSYNRLRTNLKANFKDGFPIDIEGKNYGGFPGPDNRPSIGKEMKLIENKTQ